MTRRGWIAIALVVWTIVVALRGVSVSALPNHVVAGGVFGVGGNVSQGPANPANAAGLVFYSTNQVGYTPLTGTDSYTPANGTSPAFFARDIGAQWSWVDGDEIVAVVETVRGMNGWTGKNSTTSIDDILRTGASVQDVGDGTLEEFPTVGLSGTGSSVISTWSKLADGNGNVVSYSLYRTPGPGSPIATVPTATTMTYTDTGLADGRYCYTVQVNYRRDLAGAVYGTTGRSEERCRTVSAAGNTLPTAAITSPGIGGICATGGSTVTVVWTMGDAETPDGGLRVWLNYSVGANVFPIPGMQDQNGLSSPWTFQWATPAIDGTATILLLVMDEADGRATDSVPGVRIDSTAPTATLTQPTATTNVAIDATVVITFSEAMTRAATELAISFSPSVAPLTFTWTVGDSVVTVGHAAFALSTPYTLTVSTGARDACSPGKALASAFQASFTTASGTKVPRAPSNLRVTSAVAAGISLAWDAPTQYTDGSPLSAAQIRGYDVYRATSANGTQTKIGTINATSFTDPNVQAGTEYFYWVKVVDTQSRESAFSNSVSGRTPATQAFPVDPVWIVVAVIAIILLIVGVLLVRGRKPATPPPPEAPPPTP